MRWFDWIALYLVLLPFVVAWALSKIRKYNERMEN